jgi:hypothetical protein
VKFQAPADGALLSDFDAWHCVLNNGYLALDDADEGAWSGRFPEDNPHRRSQVCQAKVGKSSERIFDLDLLAASPYWADQPLSTATCVKVDRCGTLGA